MEFVPIISLHYSNEILIYVLVKDEVYMFFFFNLICPKYKRESEGARTFQVSATRFWNSLPNEMKSNSSLEILKKSLYKYFLKSFDHIRHFTIS